MSLALFFGDGVAVGASEGNDGRWVMLFPLGVTKHRGDFPGGKMAFDKAFLASMVSNWKRAGGNPKPINFFHRGMSTPGDVTPISEKVAAGWMEQLELVESPDAERPRPGLWALTKWTDRARAHIQADELRYISPEFHPDWRDKSTGRAQGPTLFGAALLNDPYLEEMPRVAASESNPTAEAVSPATGVSNMDPKLLAALGLEAEATAEQALAAIEKLKAPPEAPKALAELQAASVQLNERVVALTEQIKARDTELASLKAEKVSAEADAFVSGLVKTGVAVPAQVEQLKKLFLADAEMAKAVFANAKPVLALGEQGIPGDAGTENKLQTAQKKLDARIAELRKADRDMTWLQAEAVALAEDVSLKVALYDASTTIESK